MTVDEPSLGPILRTAREAVGWSLSRMASATGFSKPYLSKLETGDREVKPWHLEAYDKALGGDSVRRRALLLSGTGMASRAFWSELDLPTVPLVRIGAEDLVALSDSVDVLTSLGLRYGGRVAVAAARGQLRYAVSLLDLDMADGVRQKLLATVGRLADRTAWSMADTGQLSQADRVYDFALTVTPDSVQRWLTLINMANLRLRQNQPKRALALLDRADPEIPVLGFLTHSSRAHAFARLGQSGRTLRHVEMADSAHARVDLEDLPGSIRPYESGHNAHAHSAAGRALHVLATGNRTAIRLAAERLEAAIRCFGPDRAHAAASCQRRLETLPI